MTETDKYVFFYGGPFSQWAPIQFTVTNIFGYTKITFLHAEQWMMYCKAKFFKDEEIAKKIMATESAEECKALGKKVSNFNKKDWNGNYDTESVAYQVVQIGNYYKFSQNSGAKKTLLNTGNKIIVEASPYDDIWGIKLGESDPRILDERNWRGHNLLGKALMQVRKEV